MNKHEVPRKRRRTKQLLKNIKDQVEFYFSDANLNRDKYLMKLVGHNGNNYVPLDVLLSFNQLKQMNATVKLLQKSLTDSEVLHLNKDMTAVKRRKKVIQPLPSDLDDRTVVIERLPINTTIPWLNEVCSKFGPVSYISLPRFGSGSVKGLAFVEFINSDDAVLACSVLNAPPRNFFPRLKLFLPKFQCKLSVTSNTNAQPGHPGKSNEPPSKKRRFSDNAGSSSSNHCHFQSFDNSELDSSIKRLHPDDGVFKLPHAYNPDKASLVSLPNGKNAATFLPPKSLLGNDVAALSYSCPQECSVAPTVKSKAILVNNRKIKRPATDSLKEYVSNEGYEAKRICKVENNDVKHTMHKAKKKRRRKRQSAKKGKSNKESNKKIRLQVMMKTKWAELKKTYLRSQRESFGKLKSVLQKCSSPDPETTSVYIKHHLALKKSAAENYLDMSEPECEEESSLNEAVKTKQSTPGFLPGVVASLTSLSLKDKTEKLAPLPHFKVLKSHFSQYGGVAYVDVKPGSTDGYIRFESSDAAQRAIMEEKKYGLFLLTSVHEERYWDGLLVSRQLKRSRERQRISGKEKLILRAENRIDVASKRHIKFNFNF